MIQLGNFLTIIKGNKADTVSEIVFPGAVRYLQIEDLRDGAKLKFTSASNKVLAKEEDVIIAWDGANAGTISYGLSGHVGSTLAILRFDTSQIFTPYLGYFLKSKFSYFQENCSGATIPHVNRDSLESLSIELHKISEQQRIAAILQKADRVRRLRRYARNLSESYLQSVFLEMFGSNKENRVVALEDILEEDPKNGLYLPIEFYGTGTPIIRIDGFYNGFLVDLTKLKRVRASDKQTKEFNVKNGEILINRVNSMEYLGKCAFVAGLSEPTVYESNMMRIKINRNLALPEFVTRFLCSKEAYQQVCSFAKEAVNQASINQQDVKSIQLPLPLIQIQEKFKKIYDIYNLLIVQQLESTRQAEHLFQSLLARAFSGGL